MQYTLTGKLKHVKATQKVSDKFRKREFVVTVEDSKYPQHILMSANQDKCDLLNGLKPGQEVTVHFYISGKEWSKEGTVRYFNSLDAWKIEAKPTEAAMSTKYASSVEDQKDPIDDLDDLPF